MAGELSLKTPLTGLVTLVPTNTATDKTITLPATTGTMVVQDGTNTTTVTNLAYTGTLTGGTGVVNIGSGQVYKDASGNVGIGTATPSGKFNVAGGRAFFGGNSEQYSIGVGYNQTRVSTGAQVYYIGATDSATPALVFSEAGGNERMRIDSSGNVGIGTISPLGILDARGAVYLGSTSSGTTTFVRGAANWNFAGLNVIRNAANTSTPRSIGMPLDGDDLASTTIGAYNAIWGAYDSSPTTSSTSSALNGAMVYGAYAGHRWFNNGSERMRLDSSGNLLVGTTAGFGNLGKVQIDGGASGNGLNVKCASSAFSLVCFNNGGSGLVYFTVTGSGSVGTITTDGTSTAYNTSSDYRLKENVAPMTGALAKIAELKPCTYTWKSNGSAGQGFIAHELQAVIPDAVTGDKDEIDKDGKPKHQGVDTSFLVATLTAAIQELTARLEVLENK